MGGRGHSASALPSPINFPAMGDLHDQDDDLLFPDLVDDAVIADPHSPTRGIFGALELFGSRGEGVFGQAVDDPGNCLLVLPRQGGQLLDRARQKLDGKVRQHPLLQFQRFFDLFPGNPFLVLRIGKGRLGRPQVLQFLDPLQRLQILDGDHGNQTFPPSGQHDALMPESGRIDDLGQIVAGLAGGVLLHGAPPYLATSCVLSVHKGPMSINGH